MRFFVARTARLQQTRRAADTRAATRLTLDQMVSSCPEAFSSLRSRVSDVPMCMLWFSRKPSIYATLQGKHHEDWYTQTLSARLSGSLPPLLLKTDMLNRNRSNQQLGRPHQFASSSKEPSHSAAGRYTAPAHTNSYQRKPKGSISDLVLSGWLFTLAGSSFCVSIQQFAFSCAQLKQAPPS